MCARLAHMLIYLAPLVMLIGLVMFLAARNNADLKKIGGWMFFCGLFVALLLAGNKSYSLP